MNKLFAAGLALALFAMAAVFLPHGNSPRYWNPEMNTSLSRSALA